jgi:hypothetical protein
MRPRNSHDPPVSKSNTRLAGLVFFHIHPKRLKIIIEEWKTMKKISARR